MLCVTPIVIHVISLTIVCYRLAASTDSQAALLNTDFPIFVWRHQKKFPLEVAQNINFFLLWFS